MLNVTLTWGQGQIKYFFVKTFPLKPLDIAALQVHRSYDVEDTVQCFVFVLDLRSR